MDLGILTATYPKVSETFVEDHVQGMIANGLHVTVYAKQRGDAANVAGFGAVRTKYLEDGVSGTAVWRKWLSCLYAMGTNPSRAARALRTGNSPTLRSSFKTLMLGHAWNPEPHDVLHAHFGGSGTLACAVREIWNTETKVVTTFHGVDVTKDTSHKIASGLYSYLFDSGDLFLPVSRSLRDKLLCMGCPQDRTVVHHMGVSPERIVPPNTPRMAKPRVVRILLVGRLVEKKGALHATRSVANLINRGYPIELLIAGDGPLRDRVQRYVDELDLGSQIRLLGELRRAEIVSLMQNSDILCAPSVTAMNGDEEGIPVTIMEALATGLPVVSTLHGGIPELVTDGKEGLLVPERDEEALTDALGRLAVEGNVRLTMGRRGRERILKDFNLRLLHGELIERYRGLIAE